MQLKLLLNGDTLDHYLSRSGYSSSAQHAKLCRLQVGVEYIKIEGSEAEVVRAGQVSDLVKNWLSSLGKVARARKRDILEDMGKELGNVENFLDQARPSLIMQVVKGDTKSRRGLTLWLAGVLLYGNHQRPGARANATLKEYEEAWVVEEGKRRYKVIFGHNGVS